MSKKLFIAEKPSVAQEFAKALKQNFSRRDGYQESAESVVTWCVGHLVTMSYPESYDPALKKWAVETLPFLPKEYKYNGDKAVEAICARIADDGAVGDVSYGTNVGMTADDYKNIPICIMPYGQALTILLLTEAGV